jgi:hypothetical protein
VATFVGDANLVAGTASGGSATTPIGRVALGERLDGDVQVVLRPEDLRLDAPDGNAGVAARVELCEYYGHDTVYLVRPDGSDALRARAGSVPRFARGDAVTVAYQGPPAVAYPAPPPAPALEPAQVASGLPDAGPGEPHPVPGEPDPVPGEPDRVTGPPRVDDAAPAPARAEAIGRPHAAR